MDMLNVKYLDRCYIDKISGYLPKFRWKGDVGEARCPICGDSKRDKNARRFYLFVDKRHGDRYMCKCHNCGYSSPFSKFLKEFDPSTYTEYIGEKVRNGSRLGLSSYHFKKPEPIKYIEPDPDGSMVPLTNLSPSHPAIKYVSGIRKIPASYWSEIYYTEDFRRLSTHINPEEAEKLCKTIKYKKTDPRIVFVCMDPTGENVLGIQGRALEDSDDVLRYITVSAPTTTDLVYGLNKINPQKDVYVMEGIPNTFFVRNSIAILGMSKVTNLNLPIPRENLVLVLDNTPRSPEMISLIDKIKGIYRIALLPEKYIKFGKDPNDMAKSGIPANEIEQIIRENVFSGAILTSKFIQWKKTYGKSM